ADDDEEALGAGRRDREGLGGEDGAGGGDGGGKAEGGLHPELQAKEHAARKREEEPLRGLADSIEASRCPRSLGQGAGGVASASQSAACTRGTPMAARHSVWP